MPQTSNPQFPIFSPAARARRRLSSRRRSAGYAGIAIMAVVGIAAATMMVATLNASAVKNDQGRKTGYALALAKQALIGRAASDPNRPGSLPCPDTNNDGSAELLAGNDCPSYVGRLPWKTLGLTDLRDADGERLWYVLSPNFRDDNSAIINSTTPGTLGVTGEMAVASAAAIVFAAGAPVANQDRSVANVNAPVHYLDGANGATITAFQSLAPSTAFNDRLLPVLPTELSTIVQKRVGKEIAFALDAYYAASGSVLPYAADPSTCPASPGSLAGCVSVPLLLAGAIPAVPSPAPPGYDTSILGATPSSANAWFNANGWRQQVAYAVITECVTAAGCLGSGGTFKVNTISAGYTPPSPKVTLTYAGGGGSTFPLQAFSSSLSYMPEVVIELP